MQDPHQRDQFLIRYRNNVEVYWCDNHQTQPLYDGRNDLARSLSPIDWSPLGTYIVTYHARGIILYGGDHFAECGRFTHDNVKHVIFSAHERYALTWNGATGNSAKDAVLVWDVASCHVLRRFPCVDTWPCFSFSPDEQYLVTKGSNGIGM